jgi:hypothetical protein
MTLKFLTITLILFGALFPLCTVTHAEETALSFDIPSQDVVPALDQFARLTDLSLIYKPEDIRPSMTQALSGTYLPDQALRIMLADTGLGFKKTGEETIAIVKVGVSFDIPSQHLVAALHQFGKQTALSLAYKLEDIGSAKSCVVSGVYSPDQALGIMLEGTGLSFKQTGKESFAVVRTPVPEKKSKEEELFVTPDAKPSKKNEGG